jgi:ribonuclease HI
MDEIYCDGSFSEKNGLKSAGWGVLTLFQSGPRAYYGALMKHRSSSNAELIAAMVGMALVKKNVATRICIDCQGVLDKMVYIYGGAARKAKLCDEIASLFGQELVDASLKDIESKNIVFHKVKAHHLDLKNSFVDRLATLGRKASYADTQNCGDFSRVDFVVEHPSEKADIKKVASALIENFSAYILKSGVPIVRGLTKSVAEKVIQSEQYIILGNKALADEDIVKRALEETLASEAPMPMSM